MSLFATSMTHVAAPQSCVSLSRTTPRNENVSEDETTSEEVTPPLAPSSRQAFDRSLDAVAIYTASDSPLASLVVYVNDALCALAGFAREDVVGHSALLLAGARPDMTSLASILPLLGNVDQTMRVRKQRPDGRAYDVVVSVSPLCDSAGHVTHYLAMQRPIGFEASGALTPVVSTASHPRLLRRSPRQPAR